jgi:hypothetical protein
MTMTTTQARIDPPIGLAARPVGGATRLVGVRGDHAGTSFALYAETTAVGRGPSNHLVLTTQLASRTHAELRREATAGPCTISGAATARR